MSKGKPGKGGGGGGGGFTPIGRLKKRAGAKPGKGAAKPKAMKARASRKRRT